MLLNEWQLSGSARRGRKDRDEGAKQSVEHIELGNPLGWSAMALMPLYRNCHEFFRKRQAEAVQAV